MKNPRFLTFSVRGYPMKNHRFGSIFDIFSKGIPYTKSLILITFWIAPKTISRLKNSKNTVNKQYF